MCRSAGLSATEEAIVPEWTRWTIDKDKSWEAKEALLDVVASDVSNNFCLHIDTTARLPVADRYLAKGSHKTQGLALQLAKEDNENRYPAQRGRKEEGRHRRR